MKIPHNVIERYIELNSLISELTKEKDELAGILRSLLPGDRQPGTKFELGKLDLNERSQSSLNEELFLGLKPKEQQFLIEAKAVAYKLGSNKELIKEKSLAIQGWTTPAITISKRSA